MHACNLLYGLFQLLCEVERMDKESEKVLIKLDSLAEKIDILTMVTAISMEKEKLFEGMIQRDQIKFLDDLGFNRNLIALLVGTTPLTVSVTLSKMKKKKAKPKKETEHEEKGEKSDN
jgi:hypothetical protein